MEENPYELLYMIRSGDEVALTMLFDCYRKMIGASVGKMIRTYPRLAIYREDFEQESRIALLTAIDCYREDLNTSFSSFAELVVKRRLTSLLRHETTKGLVHSHDTYSLDDTVQDSCSYYDIIASEDCLSMPEYALDFKLANERLHKAILSMNAMDRAVETAWQNGMSYEEGSRYLNISYKAYDGRLQRVKRKIREAILDSDSEDS